MVVERVRPARGRGDCDLTAVLVVSPLPVDNMSLTAHPIGVMEFEFSFFMDEMLLKQERKGGTAKKEMGANNSWRAG